MRSASDKLFRHYRSETVGTIPPAADILRGELFVNLADRDLYTKDQTDEVVQLTPSKYIFDIYSDAAGVTNHTLASLGTSVRIGLSCDTNSGAQTHEFPASWFTPNKEILVNRYGSNDLVVRVEDGTVFPIAGDLEGIILQFPGLVIIKVRPDGEIVVMTAVISDIGEF